ncbi:MAG: hypothetical protein PHH11_11485 [Methylomonas sp.]|nr:hypothetical protein [Methylomonas sp.]
MKGAQRKRKRQVSDFYKLRSKLGLNLAQAAELCGVTERTIKNWDTKGAPVTAMRLLPFWDRYHIPFEGWEGFCFSRGVLLFRGRERFTAESLKRHRDQLAILGMLETEKDRRQREPLRFWLADGKAILRRWMEPVRRYLRPFRFELRVVPTHERA